MGSQSVPVYEWYEKNDGVARNTTWTKLVEAPSEVGNYKLVITVGEDKNYQAVTTEIEFMIREAESTVIEGNQVNGVQTGDGTQVGVWAILVGLSTGMMIYFRKKNGKEEV